MNGAPLPCTCLFASHNGSCGPSAHLSLAVEHTEQSEHNWTTGNSTAMFYGQ